MSSEGRSHLHGPSPAATRRPDPARARRRPRPGAVIWASVALFAVLFAMLTFQLSKTISPVTTASKPILVRRVINRRVVTQLVPGQASGASATQVSSSTLPTTSATTASAAAPVTTSAS